MRWGLYVWLCVGVLFLFAQQEGEKTPEYYFDRAYEFQMGKKYREAVEIYTWLIKAGYITEKIYFNRGQCFLEIKKIREAKKDFKKAIELNPKYLSPWISLAVIAIEKEKKYDRAEKYLAHAQQIDSMNYLIYYNSGIVYMKKKNEIKARQLFLTASYLNAEFYPTYFYLGQIEYMLRNFRQAEQYFNYYLKWNAENPQAYYNRGLVRQQLHKKEEACTDFARAYSLGMEQAREQLKKNQCH